MIWRARDIEWDLRERALIMGILNVTPDSFSDGGRFVDVDKAVAHAAAMIRDGADIIDVGGESTRPGADPVSESDERARVLPVIESIHSAYPNVAISVDTSKAAVAEDAVEAGARIINDVTGLNGDPNMTAVAASTGAGLVIMHMLGEPRSMQTDPQYEDVVSDIAEFLKCQGERALQAGVEELCLAFDPGVGFGKNLEHNLEILRELDAFAIWDRPVLLGASRKSFIGKLLGYGDLEARRWPTVGLSAYAVARGTRILRVHDVEPNAQAVRMMEAILFEGP